MAKLVFGETTCVFDDIDKTVVLAHSWHLSNGRVYTTINGREIAIYRLIMDAPDGMDVDHQNHNPLDNRRCNLRICTEQQNMRNRRKLTPTSSKYKGVFWDKGSGKWRASIMVSGMTKWLGSFTNEMTAAQAYNSAARALFGDFACINR